MEDFISELPYYHCQKDYCDNKAMFVNPTYDLRRNAVKIGEEKYQNNCFKFFHYYLLL
jgi:hypothetical protein